MTSILFTPPAPADMVLDKENQSDVPRTPVGRSTMSLRPRTSNKTATSMHPAPTSSVLASKRVKSPYDRPRRATARPKGFQRRVKEEQGPYSTKVELDLGHMRQMSITKPTQKTIVEQEQKEYRQPASRGSDPTHLVAPMITSKGGRRKPPPANLMLGSGRSQQRPLPGFYQQGPRRAQTYIQEAPIMRIPSYKTDNIAQEMHHMGSFTSVPSLVYTGSGESVRNMVGGGSRMQVPVCLPRPPIVEVQERSITRSDPDVKESVQDVRSRLKNVSKNLLHAASLYRPQYPAKRPDPHSADATIQSSSSSSASDQFTSPSSLSTIKEDVNSSPSSSAPMTGSTATSKSTAYATNDLDGPFDVMFDQTMTFSLPREAVDELNAGEGQKWFDLAGCEPDCCLAVRSTKSQPADCPQEEKNEYIGKLVPAHHLLYASQCARLKGRPGPPLDQSGFALPLNAAYHHDPSASDLPPLRVTNQLPLVHLKVPFPNQFIVLHQYLYLQDPARLLSTLLALPPPVVLPGQSGPKPPTARLASLPLQAIVERLKNIHKLWSNVVHLGIKDEMLWRAMERAWSVVIDACQARASTGEGQQRHCQQAQQPPAPHDTRSGESRSMQHHGISSQSNGSLVDPSLVGFTHGPPHFGRIPMYLMHAESAAGYAQGRPDFPLPNHPRSAGIKSTGHVMGIPTHIGETGLIY